MTEERFTKEEMIYLGNGYITIGSGADEEKIPVEDISVRGSDLRNLDDEQICDLLNNLAEENKQLKEENEDLNEELMEYDSFKRLHEEKIERLEKENEQLKEGMIGVVDRYIRNVEHNPPSSVKTYLKVKGALVNVREGLRDLLEDLND